MVMKGPHWSRWDWRIQQNGRDSRRQQSAHKTVHWHEKSLSSTGDWDWHRGKNKVNGSMSIPQCWCYNCGNRTVSKPPWVYVCQHCSKLAGKVCNSACVWQRAGQLKYTYVCQNICKYSLMQQMSGMWPYAICDYPTPTASMPDCPFSAQICCMSIVWSS